MTDPNWPEWSGRMSFHVRALLDESGPEWFRQMRRDAALAALAEYEAERGYTEETLNLPGLAS